jgi:1,4-dihydroxy-2-naphthoate octaprenyltransferase
MAATPVVVGTALAWAEGMPAPAAGVAGRHGLRVLIQVGTNLHNDVRDFERGNDRPTGSGRCASPPRAGCSARTMHRATAWTSFGLAALLGMYLVALGGWPILLAGVASLLAGWAYSGGPRPVSHTPLGEVFVLVFFGWVAVLGSYWLQRGDICRSTPGWRAIVGLPAAAVLLVNNYRDLEDDLRSGRQTLVRLLGRDEARRQVYASMVLLPFALTGGGRAWPRWVRLLALLAMPYGMVS